VELNLSPEQAILAEAARRLLRERSPLTAVRALEAVEPGFDLDLWRDMAELGWIALAIPAEDGSGFRALEACVLAEEMGRALLPSPFVPTVMGAALIASLGDAGQRRRWLARIASGEIVSTVAIAEPGARSLWESPRLTPSGRRLAGRKRFVPFAEAADLVLVATAGPSVAALERGATGVLRSGEHTFGGEPLSELTFAAAACELFEGAASPSAASAALAGALDRGAVTALAYLVGACDRVLGMTVAHAKDREQFGRPIGSFQAVSHRLAEMRSDVDAMRVLAQQAAWRLETGGPGEIEVASALAYALPAARRVFRHAHQVHGAIGFSMEHDLQLFTRRAKATELVWGPPALHEERVARAMGIA